MTPIVSVRILAYQNAPYIRQCIDSVLMQKTTFPVEICIGEDGSTDGTREICLEYEEQYPERVRVFLWDRNLPEHRALPPARYNFINTLRKCRGKYIALLDGDDYWTDPLKLQKQVDILEQYPKIMICHHWHKYAVFQDDGYREIEAPKEAQGYCEKTITSAKELFSNELRIKIRTMLFRNIFADGNIPELFYHAKYGDITLAFLLGVKGDFYFINEEMATYRQVDDGVLASARKNSTKRQHMQIYLQEVISLWDYANKLYNGKYAREAAHSISNFYEKLILLNNKGFNSIVELIIHNLKRSTDLSSKFTINKWLIATLLTKVGEKLGRRKSRCFT